jgi:maleylpyruvate isomerase
MQWNRGSGASMIRLHDYWRSGAAYRVRIALNLKGLSHELVAHDLRTGAQRDPAFLKVNPQGLVPALEMDGFQLTQSLAIIEWLDERHPAVSLLPAVPEQRAIVRSMAQIICCDIHPLNNLRVLNALRSNFQADEQAISAWIRSWIDEGFSALEALIRRHGGCFAFGNEPSFVDCCLVPQVYSASRFQIDTSMYPAIHEIWQRCNSLEAFEKAHPSQQPGSS